MFDWIHNVLQHIFAFLLFRTPRLLIDTVPEHVPPPPTSEKLDWADLPIIDLSKADTPAGRRSLATEVCKAMSTAGFFYAINHGYTTAQTRRVFNIANATFDLVTEDEKKAYAGKSPDVYTGYKPKKTWLIEGGVSDEIEHYNINHDVHSMRHPPVVQSHLSEIEAFAKHNHFSILYPILRLLAIGMDLPEETLIEQHRFEALGESSVRFMKYYPRSEEDEARTKNVWLKGHTDIGSVTILWSQPVSGLQILSSDGKWRYVRHIENALVINTGDIMKFLSGGFYKPTIHRVIQPPKDQTQVARLGVFYFAMAADDVKLNAHKSIMTNRTPGPEADLTMAEWRKERTGKYGKAMLKKSKTEDNVVEDNVLGVVVKEYN